MYAGRSLGWDLLTEAGPLGVCPGEGRKGELKHTLAKTHLSGFSDAELLTTVVEKARETLLSRTGSLEGGPLTLVLSLAAVPHLQKDLALHCSPSRAPEFLHRRKLIYFLIPDRVNE